MRFGEGSDDAAATHDPPRGRRDAPATTFSSAAAGAGGTMPSPTRERRPAGAMTDGQSTAPDPDRTTGYGPSGISASTKRASSDSDSCHPR